MHAIELDAIAHNGQITVTLPEAYREQWDEKAVRVFVLSVDEHPAKTAATAEDFNPLKGSVIFEGDIVSPINEAWEAEQ